jgi:hypothetical protein
LSFVIAWKAAAEGTKVACPAADLHKNCVKKRWKARKDGALMNFSCAAYAIFMRMEVTSRVSKLFNKELKVYEMVRD